MCKNTWENVGRNRKEDRSFDVTERGGTKDTETQRQRDRGTDIDKEADRG